MGSKLLPATIPPYSKYLLGFNEPNYIAQSNLQESSAASLWPQVEQTAQSTVTPAKIVSPAVNYCGGSPGCIETDPFVYLDNFFAACTGCEVDHIAVHWYGCTADALSWFLDQLRQYNKKVWVTEFACAQWDPSWQDSQQFQTDYMNQAVQILENDPMVFRYAWFSGRTTGIPYVNVFGDTGQLTDLGVQYFNQPCGSAVAAIVEDTKTTSPPSNYNSLIIGLSIGVSLLILFIVVAIIIYVKSRKPIMEIV